MPGSEDPESRRQAVVRIGEEGGPESVPALLKAIYDFDWRVRKAAVDALSEAGGEDVFEGLYRALFSEDNAGARNSAAEALVRLGAPAAKALSARVKEPDPDVRKFIVDIIGEIGDHSGIQALVTALSDEDQNVRASAVEYLGRMKAAPALEPLVGMLRTEDQWLAFMAAAALGDLGDKRAVAPLLEASGDRYLKEAALDALVRLNDESAWPAFEEALSDNVPVIREIAIRGLAGLHRSALDGDRLTVSLKKRAGADDISFIVS